jgi:hypothetical protein
MASHQAPEGEGLSEVTGPGDQPDKLAEVAGLATAIADRVLEQQASGSSIPPEQFRMLVRAARVLLDNDVPWPPSVERVVMEVAKRIERAETASKDSQFRSKGDDVVAHLMQAFNAAKRS